MKLLNLLNTFDTKINQLFEFTSGKTVAIYGYGYSGQFIENVYKRVNKTIDIIIDDNPSVYKEDSYYIRALDPATTAIIVTFNAAQNVLHYLNSLGFFVDKNVFLLKNIIPPPPPHTRKNYAKYI